MSFFGSKNETQTQPAISSMKIQEKGYGTVIKICYGTNRLTPILGWYGDFYSVATESESSGGKAMGGGGGSSVTYTYFSSVLFFVGEGEIRGFGKLWKDKERHDGLTGFSYTATGNANQLAWGYLLSKHPDQALPYTYTGLAAANDYQLSDSATLGNHTFEIFGACLGTAPEHQNYLDAHVKDVITDFLTNPRYGAIDSRTATLTLDLTKLHSYCRARGILISPVIDTQKPAHEYLTEWATIANCGIVWSEGKLKFIPYAENGYSNSFGSYTPDLSVKFAFDDDFIAEPIAPELKKIIDCPNKLTVECVSRDNDYNTYLAEAKDQAAIEMYGERAESTLSLKSLCLPDIAQIIAEEQLDRRLNIRKTFTLKTFCQFSGQEIQPDLLEPMDFVSLTDSSLGLAGFKCRVVSVEDSQDGTMTFIVEECRQTSAVKTLTAIPTAAPTLNNKPDTAVIPALVNTPCIFIAPSALTVASGEIWIAVSCNDTNYGGCIVWASNDNDHYIKLGRMRGNSTHGLLTAALPTGADTDTTHTLSVALYQNTLDSVSQISVNTFDSGCYVGGEFLAYRDAALTAPNNYELSYLKRGLYGSVKGAAAGDKFALLNNYLFKYPFNKNLVDETVYFKFQGFNSTGGGLQALDDLIAYPFTISEDGGVKALLSDIPDVSGFEEKTNKVSAWSATPNNTHYPSEKLVRDEFDDVYAELLAINTSGDILLSLSAESVNLYPTIVGSIARLPAKTFTAVSAVIGCGSPANTATLEIKKANGDILKTMAVTGGLQRVDADGFTLNAITDIYLHLYSNNSADNAVIRGFTIK